jgi:hypothetical protein
MPAVSPAVEAQASDIQASATTASKITSMLLAVALLTFCWLVANGINNVTNQQMQTHDDRRHAAISHELKAHSPVTVHKCTKIVDALSAVHSTFGRDLSVCLTTLDAAE